MAVSTAERVRCGLCGEFIPRPADWSDDWDAEERAYHSEAHRQSHDCRGYWTADPVPARREQSARAMMSTGSDSDVMVADVDAREMDLVGLREVAHLLGVREQTVRQWRVRKLMPEAAELACGPVWSFPTIERWAKRTGRLD